MRYAIAGVGAHPIKTVSAPAEHAPEITAVSTIGAGDSAIAGFVAAAKQGLSYSEMLRTAVCYGSAACITEGTRPPMPEDVARLIGNVQSEKLNIQ